MQTNQGYDQKDLVNRLNRIEGQIRGIRGMCEDHRPCVEVIQQLAAAEGALGRIVHAVFRQHVDQWASKDLPLGAVDSNRQAGETIRRASRLEELSEVASSAFRGFDRAQLPDQGSS